ncbi:hypothetical protein RYA05_00005 [Pseudomonas syringae pv. actinidiae]|nr:hypothetical protein [Pseudomonas syringae pv. actinidiae]
MTSKQWIQNLMSEIESAPVECDGFSALAATVLYKHGIAYQGFVGSLSAGGMVIPLHYWIVVGEFLIDYRARMWIGEGPEVPHGVMEYQQVKSMYSGDPVSIEPASEAVYQLLMLPWPDLR